ncbi:helix-turn-helix domain-containing protein [Shewanella indica]
MQAYKFELIVTGEQQRQMRRFSGACRFVWRCCLNQS